MKKTFIAAMMLACFSLSASANTVQGPTDPEFETAVMELIAEGVYTPEEGYAMIEAYYTGDYGVATCAMASNNKNGNGKRNPDLREEEVPLSLTPVVGKTKKNKKK